MEQSCSNWYLPSKPTKRVNVDEDIYDLVFYQTNLNVVVSAELVFPWVIATLPSISSVIDVSCGVGAWTREAIRFLSGTHVRGLDHGVPESCMLIPPSHYEDVDVTNGVDCSGYDLAICLETGEHLPESSADLLI